ncbi:hypothetical protein [Pedobacter aquatilis]|uniref:hypothetical protein n=1 Tax=Pedobacter aquatilis TaxID=351343 RepID=UPI00292FDFD7|nr:hypothetical protein [Pedobacter aquatilis]
MSAHFDYPSITDFFRIHGNCGAEKLSDYENPEIKPDNFTSEEIKTDNEDQLKNSNSANIGT